MAVAAAYHGVGRRAPWALVVGQPSAAGFELSSHTGTVAMLAAWGTDAGSEVVPGGRC